MHSSMLNQSEDLEGQNPSVLIIENLPRKCDATTLENKAK